MQSLKLWKKMAFFKNILCTYGITLIYILSFVAQTELGYLFFWTLNCLTLRYSDPEFLNPQPTKKNKKNIQTLLQDTNIFVLNYSIIPLKV